MTPFPKLIPNARKVARHAYSFHLNIAGAVSGLLFFLDTAWPYFYGYLPIPAPLFGALAGLFSALAGIFRFIPQHAVSGKRRRHARR
ncbi:hypothetical protein EB230_17565 [Mesorhizobium sp. NZP2234]|uniref:DUF7940 domain-containing protein n=1 Tax=Mesorhizobium sp. NZP2234 TaxID=2483402 RepID=UPI0015577D37|nr:hypothetical protein [Mesorhizobium sp. NZP2234]QKC90014.1 hypothetical protein EB230_17565 [Mesorhizobium sp. NZP2234]